MSNRAALDVLGPSEAQLAGTSALDPDWSVVDGDGTPIPLEALPAISLLRTGVPVRDQILGFARPATGDRVWVQGSTLPRYDTDGTLLGVIADISARREAEVALRRSEERYRQIVETAMEGIWLIDPEYVMRASLIACPFRESTRQQWDEQYSEQDEQHLQPYRRGHAEGIRQCAGDRHPDGAGHKAESKDETAGHADASGHQFLCHDESQWAGGGGKQADQAAGEKGHATRVLSEQQDAGDTEHQCAEQYRAAPESIGQGTRADGAAGAGQHHGRGQWAVE
jgi:PAS domain-containing protein